MNLSVFVKNNESKLNASVQGVKKFLDNRFGLSIHWGVYSQFNRYEWVLFGDRMDIDEPDSPYYRDSEDEARASVHDINNDPMCKVMEVYDLTADMEVQLAMKRAWSLHG